MAPDFIVILGSSLVTLGVFSSNQMFPIYNRPLVFAGAFGNLFFGIVLTTIVFGGMALVVWSFLHISWYINLLLIFLSVFGFSLWYNFLPSFLRESAFGPLIAAVGLIILNCVAWF